MAEKKSGAAVKKENSKPHGQKFTRRQILESGRYKGRKDLVSALLDAGREYTITEVDRMIDRFMKGKVK